MTRRSARSCSSCTTPWGSTTTLKRSATSASSLSSAQGTSSPRKRPGLFEGRAVMRSFVALASVLLVFAPTAAVAQTDTTRTFEVRDIRLKDGQSLGIQLHPTELPIEIESSEPDLEVCPNGWPSFAGFLECLPLDDGRLVLPSTVVATFHLGIRVQGIDRASVRVKELRITYEPGDGYFILQPPALAAG